MRRPCGNLIFVLMLFLSLRSAAWGQTFVVQGSTTFTHDVMVPYQKAIEASSGHTLTVITNKTSLGLLALLEKRADFAMISGPLETQITLLKVSNPNLPFEQLHDFKISQTYVAFVINRDNPVHKITNNQVRDILLGKILNWNNLGGPDLLITIVHVREGDGVLTSVENELLDDRPINTPNQINVQTHQQVVRIVEQLPEMLGLAQMGSLSQSNARQLEIDSAIQQHLDLVTLGDPTPEMRKVIDAARSIASTAMPVEKR